MPWTLPWPGVLAELAIAAAAFTAGHSVQERPIRVAGPEDANVLVVGSIHGNETAGQAVIRELRRRRAPVRTVMSVNPDGVRRGTRQNARGVDLNRNFPRHWRGGGRPFDVYFPGAGKGSEPETRAVMRLVRRLRPQVTIWFHQQMRLVHLARGADPAVVRAYGRRVGLPARKLPFLRGTATSWQNHTFPGTSAFVVELAAGPLSRAQVDRHVRAILAASAEARAAATAKPPIEWTPIPFGERRKRQMRAYSRRHYGDYSAQLKEVRTIVEHVTASSTFSSAYNTFAANARDAELGETPGVCAHFLIDTDGTIHQLVRLKYRCRHTVGLNDRSIGIEHVARTDAELLARPRQLSASLRLTRWLQERYGIPTRHVIGHAESLSSPFHHERVKRLRRQTHGDMAPATMRRYRARL
jgi:beta-N-acetylhexosaminidase